MKKVIIGMACCAAIAPLAFGQGPQMARLAEQGVTVTAPNAAVKIEGGEAAGYQPPKTLVVHSEGPGRYVLEGRGHAFNSKGEVVRTKITPGTPPASSCNRTGVLIEPIVQCTALPMIAKTSPNKISVPIT